MKKRLFALILACVFALPAVLTSCSVETAAGSDPEGTTGEAEKTDGTEETEPETTVSNEPVYEDTKDMLRDTIVLSVFWPPMKGFTDDIQYEYLKNANIDLLEYNSDPLFSSPSVLNTAIEACEKYGLKLTVFDSKARDHWLSLTDEEIRTIAEKYAKYEPVIGFYLVDEPGNANPFGRIARVMCDVMPGAVCQMNMLPAFALKDAQGHAEDWVNAAGVENLRYLSYDHYPFGLQANSRPQMFDNMELVRSVGLKYGVDTALYIQATSNMAGFRDPDEGEMRYHTSAAIAYGFKNLKYFTWMTPVERTEDFADAIIDPDGRPTEKYEWVCGINADIKKIADIAGRCNAVQILHSGKRDSGTERLTSSFFVQPDGSGEFIFSVMKDKYNGSEYLMIVNKDFNGTADATFKFKGITQITDLTDGEAVDITLDKGVLTASFKEGGFRFYKLPEGTNIAPEYEDADKDNLAEGKAVYSSSSMGESGWYNYRVADGSTKYTDSAKGYKPEEIFGGGKDYVMIDLAREIEINRVDVYPAGKGASVGTSFPLGYEVLVSSDNVSFTKVAEFSRDGVLTEVPSHSFDNVKCRYVKLVFTSPYSIAGEKTVELAEIMIYNDKGDIPEPEAIERPTVDLKGNFALGKSVFASSNVGAWGWDTVCVNDGERKSPNSNPGWSSQVGIHRNDPYAEEWIMIDLETVAKINRVEIYPRESGIYFPVKLEIQVSENGNDFTTVYTYEDASGEVSGEVRVFEFDEVSARFVRAVSKEMTELKTSPDGYLFQMSEFEIYYDK